MPISTVVPAGILPLRPIWQIYRQIQTDRQANIDGQQVYYHILCQTHAPYQTGWSRRGVCGVSSGPRWRWCRVRSLPPAWHTPLALTATRAATPEQQRNSLSNTRWIQWNLYNLNVLRPKGFKKFSSLNSTLDGNHRLYLVHTILIWKYILA